MTNTLSIQDFIQHNFNESFGYSNFVSEFEFNADTKINQEEISRAYSLAKEEGLDEEDELWFKNLDYVLKSFPNSIFASLMKVKIHTDLEWWKGGRINEDDYEAICDQMLTYINNGRGGDLYRDGYVEVQLLPNYGFGCLCVSRIVEGKVSKQRKAKK